MAVPLPVGLRFFNSLTRLSRVVAWGAPNTGTTPLLGFNVYRGQTALFTDAVKLTPAPIPVAFFEDPLKQRVEGFTYYYFVTSVDQGNNESAPAGPVSQEFTPFRPNPRKSSVFSHRRACDEIRRRHGKILQFDGEVGHYLMRKVAGPVAQDYDNLRRDTPYRSNPSTGGEPAGNYGTRFAGGYEIIPNVLWRYIPVTTRLSREELGLTAGRTPTMWVVDFPILQPRDIIIRQNNERYRVSVVRPQSLGGRITRQVAELEFLEPSDIIYNFPTPVFVDKNAPDEPQIQKPYITNPAKLPDKSSN
jgi:hypothetical protein